MRRISLLTCFISLIYVYAHAETVYFQNPGDNWNYITENGSYKDSQGNDLPADWSAEDWANADVIISPEFMNNDHIAGVNADWTVKSLTFADGIGPGNKQYIWWNSEKDGHVGAGKTVTVLEDVNINTEFGGEGQWNWWRWVVGGDFIIDIAPTRAARNMTMHGLNGLIIGSETSEGNFIVENVGSLNMNHIGDAVEVFTEGLGVKVYGDFTVRNAGYFGMQSIKNGLYIKGNLLAENFNIDDSHTGELSFWQLQSGGVYIGGNVTLRNIGDFTLSSAQGGVVMNQNLIADGIKNIFIENVKGGDGIRINGGVSLSNMNTFRANNSDGFYVGGDVTSANNDGWFDVYGIGRIDWQAKGGVHFAGATTDLRGFYGINMEAVGFFRAEGDFYTNQIAGDTAGLGENDVQIGTLLFDKNFEINGNANLSRSAYIKVGGDLNLKGTANAMFGQTYGADGQMVSSSNAGVEILGNMNFDSGTKFGTWFRSVEEDPNRYAKNQFINVGGLDGTGILYTTNENVIDKTEAYSVTYTINSTGNSRFEGEIHQYTAGGNGSSPSHAQETDWENMKLNIVKNGTGTQSIIIRGYDSLWRGTVTVNEGTLKLFTPTSEKVKVDLTLNGGSLAVEYEKEGIHNPDEDYMGYIRAGKIDIAGDTNIIFDVTKYYEGGYEADLIKADEVSGSGIATLVLDLDANYFTEGQVVEDLELRIFQIADNSYEWADALVKVMYNGSDISYKFSKLVAHFDANTNEVYAVLTGIVPEPAAVSAILGAIALAFAAYRRHRR